MLDPGQLRHRVTLQVASRTRTARGNVTETWNDIATVWARIRAVSGREYFAAQQAQSEVKTEITARYRRGVTPAWRVKHGNSIYDIEAVLPDIKNEYMRLMCVEHTT